LVLPRAEREQPLECRLDVVNVPVDDGAARRLGVALGRVPAVDDAQLVLVVADPELGVSGPVEGSAERRARGARARRPARPHEPIRARIGRLVERGRRDGSFNHDLPEEWLLAVFFALLHAAAETRLEGLDETSVAEALELTILKALRPIDATSALDR
jgi:hypothetical protein